MAYLGKFSEVVRYLKKHLPPAFPVSARRKYGLPKNTLGDIELVERNGEKKFVIRITRKIGNDHAIMHLLHEFAHAISWQENQQIDTDDHGPEWGVAYSRVYRTFKDYLNK